MPSFSLPSPVAEILRARHIAEVLIRNGLGFVAEISGVARFVPFWRKRRAVLNSTVATLSPPKRLRRTLEELGPAFIKLGQILSTRPDILPPAYVVELTKLLSAAPPVPLADILQAVESELGEPLSQHFAEFSPEPIASASIGQVHRATLHDGTQVVVKIQRPGVERIVLADLHLLQAQARFLESRAQVLARYGLMDIMEEFSQALHDELDYTVEGRNADRLREMLQGEGVILPKVYWALSSKRVITLTDLRGTELSDVEGLRAQGLDLTSIAELVAQSYLRQIFVHGVFHADPHPANVLVIGRQIGLVDFGIVGYLTRTMRDDLGDLLFALVRQDPDEMVYTIIRMGAAQPALDRDALRRDVQRIINRYYGASLESLPIAEFLHELMTVSWKHQVRLPSGLALLARTVIVLEGVTRNLDPAFNVAAQVEPFIRLLARERFSLRREASELAKTALELSDLAQVLPRRIDLLTEQLGRGEVTLGIDVRKLDATMRKLDSIGNRLSFSVIVAALIMGLALLASVGATLGIRIPFTEITIPVTQIGFIAAALSGAWLLLSIVRSRGL